MEDITTDNYINHEPQMSKNIKLLETFCTWNENTAIFQNNSFWNLDFGRARHQLEV
jgi:hypothetical protein